MSGDKSPFSSDYAEGSRTEPTSEPSGPVVDVSIPSVPAQTRTAVTGAVPTVDQLIEVRRYGLGKPRRIVVRGKISRD